MSSISNEEIPMDVDVQPSSTSSLFSNVPNTADKPLQYKPMKKVLHLCRSFKELQAKAQPPDELYDNFSEKDLVGRAKKCYEKAEAFYHSGDEELAYMFYNFSIDAVFELQSRPEYEADEEKFDLQLPDSRQEYILEILKFLTDSLKRRYGQNWKESDKTPSDKSFQLKQDDENRKESLIEDLLENALEPTPDIQLKVSPKDYAIQLQQMIDSVDILNKKKDELKIIENLLEKLSEGENEQSDDNIFKNFIPNDNKCQFGCDSVKGFVLGDNFVCKNGHRVCSKHRSDFPICPNCENEWLKLSESYFMSLERECPFAENGCQEKVKLEDMEKHLGICEWTLGNKQVLKFQWRKIVTEAKIIALEVKVAQEREKVEEMEEPLTKAGCEFAPLEILRQRNLALQMAINGEKNKVPLVSSSLSII